MVCKRVSAEPAPARVGPDLRRRRYFWGRKNQKRMANSELHPGERLFFPLWDVSTSNRLTYIILMREVKCFRCSIRWASMVRRSSALLGMSHTSVEKVMAGRE